MTHRIPTDADRETVRARPDRAPVMYQTWKDLLFLHWEWEPAGIQRTLPRGLHVDTFNGRAYLGIVPFKMRRIRPRFMPPVPGISNFLELNLRTYVHDDAGLPGVWFYSLDANRRLAVAVARRFFGLPYHFAKMQARGGRGGAPTDFHWARNQPGEASVARSLFTYRGTGPPRRAAAGTLEYFLVERYVLFSAHAAQLRSGRVHHEPYPLRDAEVSRQDAGLLRVNGFTPPARPPDHALTAPGVDVSIYALE